METTRIDKAAYHLLLNWGVKYCYSKTVTDERYPYHTRIFLKPAAGRFKTRRLPKAFDTYFNINAEPKLMANGIDEHTTVLVTPDK